MISYHFYAVPTPDQTPEIKQFTFFEQADRFLATVGYIEEIRKRLSPETRTAVDEIGAFSAGDAYVFGQLVTQGIDVANEAGFIGYPTHFAGLSLVDWNTGAPNARFRVLELLKNSVDLGAKLVNTSTDTSMIYALGFISPNGDHKLLLVNKRSHPIEVALPEQAKKVEYVDQTTKSDPPVRRTLNDNKLTLGGYGVAVLWF